MQQMSIAPACRSILGPSWRPPDRRAMQADPSRHHLPSPHRGSFGPTLSEMQENSNRNLSLYLSIIFRFAQCIYLVLKPNASCNLGLKTENAFKSPFCTEKPWDNFDVNILLNNSITENIVELHH
jgi:hypothetical protein